MTEIWPELAGRRVRQLSWIPGGAVSFSLSPPSQHLVLGLSARCPFVSVATKAPRLLSAPPWLAGARRLLKGTRILECQRSGAHEVTISLQDPRRILSCRVSFGQADLSIAIADRTVFRIPRNHWSGAGNISGGSFSIPTIDQAADPEGHRIEEFLRVEDLHQRTRRRRTIKRKISSLKKRRAAIIEDLSASARIVTLTQDADLLLGQAGHFREGSDQLVVEDWNQGGARRVIPLHGLGGPVAEANRLYRQVKKLRRRVQVARDRLALTDRELEAAATELERASSDHTPERHDVAEPHQNMAGPIQSEPPDHTRPIGPRAPRGSRTFLSSTGQAIWVGRGAKENDALVRSSKPHFTWLHVRGMQGSHVVIPTPKGQPPAQETLLDAATLAARFSSVSKDAIVDVIHTQVRYLRKPKKAPPGTVIVTQERVLSLRREPAREQRLLDARVHYQEKQSKSH